MIEEHVENDNFENMISKLVVFFTKPAHEVEQWDMMEIIRNYYIIKKYIREVNDKVES